MPLRERKSHPSSQPQLFRSSHSDEAYPYQHRNSISDLASTSPAFSLTQALLDAYPTQFKAATQSPFLEAAGLGSLSKSTLSKWLSQDRLYAETYISFITSLIARVHLPYSYVKDKSKSLRWRIVRLLTGALDNIHRELEFFEKTAKQYDLNLNAPMSNSDSQPFAPVHATQQYIGLFRSFYTDSSLPLLEGLVVLWGTEQCYLSAWTYASEHENHNPPDQDSDGGALRKEFIPNWSSPDFQKFVDDIAVVTNDLAIRENASKKLEVYKAVWSHVLDIEARFWPQI